MVPHRYVGIGCGIKADKPIMNFNSGACDMICLNRKLSDCPMEILHISNKIMQVW